MTRPVLEYEPKTKAPWRSVWGFWLGLASCASVAPLGAVVTLLALGVIHGHHAWFGAWNANDLLGAGSLVAAAGIALGGAACLLGASRGLGPFGLLLSVLAALLGPSMMCA